MGAVLPRTPWGTSTNCMGFTPIPKVSGLPWREHAIVGLRAHIASPGRLANRDTSSFSLILSSSKNTRATSCLNRRTRSKSNSPARTLEDAAL